MNYIPDLTERYNYLLNRSLLMRHDKSTEDSIPPRVNAIHCKCVNGYRLFNADELHNGTGCAAGKGAVYRTTKSSSRSRVRRFGRIGTHAL
jgi:hypothetical protein